MCGHEKGEIYQQIGRSMVVSTRWRKRRGGKNEQTLSSFLLPHPLGTLTLNRPQEEDSGVYVCTAQGVMGTIQLTIEDGQTTTHTYLTRIS